MSEKKRYRVTAELEVVIDDFVDVYADSGKEAEKIGVAALSERHECSDFQIDNIDVEELP